MNNKVKKKSGGILMRQNDGKTIRRRKILIALMEYLVVLGCLITLFVMITPKENITKTANSYAKPEEVTKYVLSDGYISRIRPLTKYNEFKEIAENSMNENYKDKYTVKVYSDNDKNREITDGYITTGMIVEYSLQKQEVEQENDLENEVEVEKTNQIPVEEQEDDTTIDFIANVIGDITKDGDCNISELTQIIRHIVGIESLNNQEKELSADFNGDRQIDVTDVSMCINYIVYGTMEADKLVPNAPTILINGENNQNKNWYNSDVEIEIIDNEKEEGEISKTQTIVESKLEGEENKRTQGTTDKEFRLNREGNYKITSQNYGSNGTRSEIIEKEVNIDKTLPEIINLQEENIDSTTSNIYLRASDNIGVVKYKVIKDEEEKIAREVQTTNNLEERIEISENGRYTLIVEDIAGNTKEQEIEIRGLKNNFTIKFQNEDGTVLSVQSHRKGEKIDVVSNPTKIGNETYIYKFIGWEPEISEVVTKDEIYIARYEAIYKEYSVKFVDDNENILSEKSNYHYGDLVEIPEGDFSKEDDTYNYEFIGWNVEVENQVTRNRTYKAVYNKIPKEYTIRFLNEDGTEIIEERTFKSTDTALEDEPIPPHIDGYVGKWEEYTLRPENIEVRVYYEEAAGEGETLYYTDKNGITWSFVNENGYATNIYYDSGNINSELLEIPYSLDGYIAKSLGHSFASNIHQVIHDVKLPKTLETISDYAFSSRSELTSIKIPNSVINIGVYAFKQCNNLKNISIPNSVVIINESAFENCSSLTEVELPDTISEIGARAFAYCNNLKSVKIPNGVVIIEDYTFESCENLTEVELPDTITEIGVRAFGHCNNLTKIVVPDSVKTIKQDAFYDCYNLTELKLENGLESIENSAFSNCHKLEIVEIPSSVINIGYFTFYNCDSLKDIYINNYEDNLTLSNYWYREYQTYVHFNDCKHSIVNNINSEEMTLEVLDEDILQEGQINCGGTLRFKLVDNNEDTILDKKIVVESEGKYKNSNWTKEIIEPDNEGIFSIKNINRNKSISIFENINNWDKFITEDENEIKWNYTYYNGKAIDIYYESGEIGETLSIPSQLNGYPVRNINFEEGSNNIFGEYYNKTSKYNISTISIPEGIEGIERSSFAGLNKIKEISIPSSVTYIEDYAFYNCENLTDIYIDNEKADVYLGTEWNPYAYVHYKECKHEIEFEKHTNAYSSVENINNNLEDGKINCHDTYKFRLLDNNGEIVTSQKVLIEFKGLDIGYRDYERVVAAIENASYSFENGEEGVLEIKPDEEGVYEIPDIHRNLKIMIGAFQSKDNNGITWNYSLKNGNAENVYYEKGSLSREMQIPDTLDGYPVVSIENKEGPSNIFEKADNRDVIENIKIPNGVGKIGRYAFFGMNNLLTIELPDTLEKIGYAAFYQCKNLTELNLPDSVIKIDDWALSSCESLNSIRIPSSVSKIGKGAFSRCINLKNIEILGDIEEIDDNTFIWCENLSNINIPNTVKRIGMAAFARCDNIREISIPNSIKEIDSYAFSTFYIENIYIDQLEKNIQLNEAWNTNVERKVHFADCKHTIDIKVYSENVEIDNITDKIQDNKIQCRDTYKFKLTDKNSGEVLLNQEVNIKIENQEEAIYPDEQGIYTIENIKRNVTIKINNSDKYKTTTDTNGITWEYTYEDGNAVDVHYLAGELGETVQIPDNLNGYPVVEVENNKSNYNIFNKNLWNDSKDQEITEIILPESLQRIGSNAFSNCAQLHTINIPDNVTNIGNYAFYGCNNLVSISALNTTSIGDCSYLGCSSLESIEFPNVTNIGNNAFSGCDRLASIELPNVASIGESAFCGCTGLYKIELPNAVNIGAEAFSWCYMITSVELPKAIIIDRSGFSSCFNLRSIEIPDVTTIGNNAFSGCRELASLEIPNATSIGDYSFSDCTSLESIDIANVISIGEYAFNSCNNLNSIVIWKNVEELGKRTFDNWNNNQTIYVEAEQQPQGWSKKWNYGCSAQIEYAYTGN